MTRAVINICMSRGTTEKLIVWDADTDETKEYTVEEFLDKYGV